MDEWKKAQEVLSSGGCVVIPTDTLYGFCACADTRQAVVRVYELKGRDEGKPCIVLISDVSELSHFSVMPDARALQFLRQEWPSPLSVLLPCLDEKFRYLHRGTNEIAFRLPKHAGLIACIRTTGPLVAPSANPQGKPPARTIREARAYFGDAVGAYVDGGECAGEPSTLVRIVDGTPVILRQGAWVSDS